MFNNHKDNAMHYETNRILLIDDNPHIRNTLPIQLDRHFRQTKTLESPEGIPEILKNETFDIILLDMNFSVGAENGQEGLYWLREIKKRKPDVIVVLLTGMEGADKAVDGLQEGAADFVIKPWHPDKLITNLKLLLRLRTLEQKAEKHKKLLGKRNKHDFINLEEMEKLVIEKAIYVYQGNLSHAARQLGITRATLYAKMKKYDLSSEKQNSFSE